MPIKSVSKRAFDLILAAIGLMLIAPLILGLGVAIKLDSPGPMLYRGTRVGRYGLIFSILKLRTMKSGADRAGPRITRAGDQRITRLGALIRRFKLDELPQLANVLRGEMSLVGPRPEHPNYARLYTTEQRRLLQWRPGLTSPASLAYVDEEELLASGSIDYAEDVMPKKLAIDLAYFDHATFGSDLTVMWQTLMAVVGIPKPESAPYQVRHGDPEASGSESSGRHRLGR